MTDLKKMFESMEFDSTKSMGYNDRVLFIDGLNTFIRNWCAIPTLDDNGNHIGGLTGFLKSIGMQIRNLKPTRVVVIFDGAGGSQRRRELYPEYKSKRKPITRVNRTYDLETAEEEQHSMRNQLMSLASMLTKLPVTVISLDNIEADDAIAYASEWVVAQGGKSIILSTDKDFLQLIGENTDVLNPAKKKYYTVTVVVNEYRVHPDNFVLYRALTGDKSDNIPGINGIGEIKPGSKSTPRLLKHFPEITDTVIDLDYIYDKSVKHQADAKIYQSIVEGRHIIERNMVLMNLKKPAISDSAKLKILNTMQTFTPSMDKVALTKLLVQGSFIAGLPNYHSWLATTFSPLLRFYGTDHRI